MIPSLAFAVTLSLAQAPSPEPAPLAYRVFEVKEAGEATAVVRASCERCDWAVEGREAAVLRISFDGRYSQHVVLTGGSGTWEYHLTLGAVSPGTHRLFVYLDPALSARDTGK